MTRVDRLADLVWPAAKVEDLDGWRCRFDRGVTRRANSVLPAASGNSLSLAGRCARVEAAYRSAALPICFQVTDAALPEGLDRFLAARGYARDGSSLVQGAAIADAVPSGDGSHPVALLDRPGPEWLSGTVPRAGAAEVAARAGIIARIALPRVFAVIGRGGRTDSVGMAVAAAGWGWINCMHTLEAFRGRGAAGAILGALARWAAGQGAKRLYLQVSADNAAARRVYARRGFRTLYGYHYRILTDDVR
jgi:GNAT superfamily N-acetyltransferase